MLFSHRNRKSDRVSYLLPDPHAHTHKNHRQKYIRSIELGNEPDHWLKPAKCFRNLTWSYEDYRTEAVNLANAVISAMPKGHSIDLQVRMGVAAVRYITLTVLM